MRQELSQDGYSIGYNAGFERNISGEAAVKAMSSQALTDMTAELGDGYSRFLDGVISNVSHNVPKTVFAIGKTLTGAAGIGYGLATGDDRAFWVASLRLAAVFMICARFQFASNNKGM